MVTSNRCLSVPQSEKLGKSFRIYRHDAMATCFEVRLHPDASDATYGEQATHAAFTLLERLEERLSRFRENSDLSRVNRWAGRRDVPVNPGTFRLLQRSLELNELTEGAFDITASPERPRKSSASVLELDARSRRVLLRDREARLDLGGVGKGFALDEMAKVLREWDLGNALLMGGGSSLLALSERADGRGWLVRVEGRREPIELKREGLGASGLARGPHILDPSSGCWAERRQGAWCVAPDATTADALSTACMVLDRAAVHRVCRRASARAGVVHVSE
jgi:thiamine biosynthesis lipoprotein